MGETRTSERMRYDHGPSRIDPSSPIVCLRNGRTTATDDDPVMPKTQKMTAASVPFSRQVGRACVVQAQKRSYGEALPRAAPFPLPPLEDESRRPVAARACRVDRATAWSMMIDALHRSFVHGITILTSDRRTPARQPPDAHARLQET
eukprot:scaffold16653_cov118-Isochrysis_galbana.AAC.3